MDGLARVVPWQLTAAAVFAAFGVAACGLALACGAPPVLAAAAAAVAVVLGLVVGGRRDVLDARLAGAAVVEAEPSVGGPSAFVRALARRRRELGRFCVALVGLLVAAVWLPAAGVLLGALYIAVGARVASTVPAIARWERAKGVALLASSLEPRAGWYAARRLPARAQVPQTEPEEIVLRYLQDPGGRAAAATGALGAFAALVDRAAEDAGITRTRRAFVERLATISADEDEATVDVAASTVDELELPTGERVVRGARAEGPFTLRRVGGALRVVDCVVDGASELLSIRAVGAAAEIDDLELEVPFVATRRSGTTVILVVRNRGELDVRLEEMRLGYRRRLSAPWLSPAALARDVPAGATHVVAGTWTTTLPRAASRLRVRLDGRRGARAVQAGFEFELEHGSGAAAPEGATAPESAPP